MSNYDYRDRPAYNDPDSRRYTNANIKKWWTPAHDRLLEELIRDWQWDWYWEVADAIASTLRSDAFTEYMRVRNWYNNVMYFAITRANDLHLTDRIRKPDWKICPLCNQRFIENSLPQPLVSRLGIAHLDFCAPCLRDTVLRTSGNSNVSREQAIQYIRDLTATLQRIPSQGYGESMADLRGMTFPERLALLRVLRSKPTVARVKQLFGSWLEALIAAGVLQDDALRTARGVHCIARDGHICLSLGEKTIDDYLSGLGIAHSKEAIYPGGAFRADFKIGDVLLEYFGLQGNPDYDAKTERKMQVCQEHRVALVALFPRDLASPSGLERKLRPITMSLPSQRE